MLVDYDIIRTGDQNRQQWLQNLNLSQKCEIEVQLFGDQSFSLKNDRSKKQSEIINKQIPLINSKRFGEISFYVNKKTVKQ